MDNITLHNITFKIVVIKREASYFPPWLTKCLINDWNKHIFIAFLDIRSAKWLDNSILRDSITSS